MKYEIMDDIIISVITVTYNCCSLIDSTIRSVINQDYSNLQYIIIDGESTDGTMDIIKKYEDEISVVVSEKDYGIADAFNKGIDYAKGELILLLNAGDTFVSDNVISNVVKDWIDNNKPDFLFYKVMLGKQSYMPVKEDENDIWNSCQQPHQGSFISKKTYSIIGKYNIDYKLRMDYDYFARCKEACISHKYIPKAIVNYLTGGASMQLENAKIFYAEGIRVNKRYNLHGNLSDYILLYLPRWARLIGRKIIRR